MTTSELVAVFTLCLSVAAFLVSIGVPVAGFTRARVRERRSMIVGGELWIFQEPTRAILEVTASYVGLSSVQIVEAGWESEDGKIRYKVASGPGGRPLPHEVGSCVYGADTARQAKRMEPAGVDQWSGEFTLMWAADLLRLRSARPYVTFMTTRGQRTVPGRSKDLRPLQDVIRKSDPHWR